MEKKDWKQPGQPELKPITPFKPREVEGGLVYDGAKSLEADNGQGDVKQFRASAVQNIMVGGDNNAYKREIGTITPFRPRQVSGAMVYDPSSNPQTKAGIPKGMFTAGARQGFVVDGSSNGLQPNDVTRALPPSRSEKKEGLVMYDPANANGKNGKTASATKYFSASAAQNIVVDSQDAPKRDFAVRSKEGLVVYDPSQNEDSSVRRQVGASASQQRHLSNSHIRLGGFFEPV